MDQPIKQDIQSTRERLKTLRDQVRVKIHLAGMDAKDTFRELEREAEKLSHDFGAQTRRKLDTLIDRLSALVAPLD